MMKQTIKTILALLVLLISSTGAWAADVAKIGTTGYTTLKAALDAVADGQTIDILSNSDESTIDKNFGSNDLDFTIDLHGHDVKFHDILNKKGHLTIKSTENGGKFSFDLLYTDEDLTFDNVTIESTNQITGIKNVTITGSTVSLTSLNNTNDVDLLKITNSTVTISNHLEWCSKNVTLATNSTLTLQGSAYFVHDSNNLLVLSIDATSSLVFDGCTIGAMTTNNVRNPLLAYVKPGEESNLHVNDGETNNITLKEYSHAIAITDGTATVGGVDATSAKAGQTVTVTARATGAKEVFLGWTAGASDNVTFANAAAKTTTFTMPDNNVTIKANFIDKLKLKHTFGTDATVTFWDGGTTEPVPSTFDTTHYPKDGAGITEIDNTGFTEDHYMIVYIKPKDGYWTNQQLLFVTETGAMLAPRRAPGLDLGQSLKFLKADEYDATGYGGMKDRYDGAGWYYYKLSKDHTITAGYTSSTVDGYVVPQFDLSTGVLSSTEASTSATTLTVNATDGWQAVITIDQSSYPYNGELQNSAFTHNIVVKKDGTTALEIPKTRHGKHIVYSIKSKTEPITWVEGVKDAGDYTAQISALFYSYFKNAKVGVPFKITPKELTANVTAQSKTYDGTTDATVTGTVETGVTGETLTISGLKGTFDDANVGTDKTVTIDASAVSVVAGANTKTSNYNITYPTTAKANITAKSIDIPDDPSDPKYNDIKVNVPTEGYTYDGTEKKPTVTVKDGSTVLTLDKDYTVSYTNNKDAGDNTATVTVKGKDNYTIDETRQFSIAKKELKANVKVTAKVYDSTTDATVTATVETGITGETLNISGVTGTFSDAEVGTDKTVTINSSAAVVTAGETGTKTSNYNITYPATATGNITLKAIVSPDDPNDPNYDAIKVNVPAEGYTYDGTEKKPTVTVKDGEAVLTLDKDYTVSYTNNINAGDNTAVVSITGKGDYTIDETRKFSIAKAALTIAADDKEREEGEENPTLTATYTGFVNGENKSVLTTLPTLKTTATKESTPGDYPITASGAEAANYAITYMDGTLTVHPKGSSFLIPSGDEYGRTIRVVRNDTGKEIPNVATLTYMNNKTSLRIDKVTIDAPADASASNPVSVSIYIPNTLRDEASVDQKVYGVGSDIIVTDVNVPVTDIYLPETTEMIKVADHPFYQAQQEDLRVRVHTPLALLDDYALTPGLKNEYEVANVMSTVETVTNLWTLSSSVDILVPEGLTALICEAISDTEVAATSITSTKVTVNEKERTIVKANNGVMMSGKPGSYDLIAWPSADRPSGSELSTDDAKSYPGNQLVPAIVETHFTPNDYYILYNNTFHELKSDDTTSVPACKAVLRKTSALMAPSLSISINGITTSLSEELRVKSEEFAPATGWYTLNGVKLDSKPTAKGVYINNGRKVVVK